MKKLLRYFNPIPPKGMIDRASGMELWLGGWILLWNVQYLFILFIPDKDLSAAYVTAYQIWWVGTAGMPLYFPPLKRLLNRKKVITHE